MSLKRLVVLVTGAGSGLGRATAERFANSGARVIGIDLQKTDAPFLTAQADVTSEADIKRVLDFAKTEYGSVPNVVVNCAGILLAKRVQTKKGPHPLEDFMKVQTVNVGGTFNVIRLASAAMAESLPFEGDLAIHDGQRGVIINTASIAAYEGQIGQAAYAASKGAIVALTLPLARDLAREKIRVNAIAPGIFRTPMVEALSDAAKASIVAGVPFPARFGEPSDFAHLVESLVTNPMINGEVVRIDGAARLAPM